jgi:hypothetical protein
MSQSTEQLAALIAKKHDVLMQLRAIGIRQSDLVANGEIAALLKLLAAKQQLINRLQELEHSLKPFYETDPDKRAWRTAEARARCASQASECNAMLEEIVQLEKLGAEKMNDRKNEVAQQLQHVHAAAHVRSAYQTQQ